MGDLAFAIVHRFPIAVGTPEVVFSPHLPKPQLEPERFSGGQSINGAGSWDANPWVWVVEFRRAA